MTTTPKPTPPRDNVRRLVPARPNLPGDSASYMPRIPWTYVVLGTLTLIVVIGGYYLKQRHKADELRAMLVRMHEVDLAKARADYTAVRDKLEALIVTAANADAATLVDPRFRLAGLHSGKGLYLRLPLTAAKNRGKIAEEAKLSEPDQIATCLGLKPEPAHDLYTQGDFLAPEYLEQLKAQTDFLHLRVDGEMLSRRIRNDLPEVVAMMRSDWFMLVLEEGENRRDSPVRVFVWDLARNELLLRARVQSQGALLTTRILSKTTESAPPLDPERVRASAANDCSIAGKLKQISGT